MWYVYGTNAAKSPIDRLEGDTVVSAVETLAHKWYRKVVTIHIDNSAFQLSARKGWSRADRLNDLLKTLFFLCVKYNCVIDFVWIPTAQNILADALSRKESEAAFLAQMSLQPFLAEHGGVLYRNPTCGSRRSFKVRWRDSLNDNRPPTSEEMGLSPGHPNHNAFDGARSMPQPYSVPYSRGSIYLGIPSDALIKRLD